MTVRSRVSFFLFSKEDVPLFFCLGLVYEKGCPLMQGAGEKFFAKNSFQGEENGLK